MLLAPEPTLAVGADKSLFGVVDGRLSASARHRDDDLGLLGKLRVHIILLVVRAGLALQLGSSQVEKLVLERRVSGGRGGRGLLRGKARLRVGARRGVMQLVVCILDR